MLNGHHDEAVRSTVLRALERKRSAGGIEYRVIEEKTKLLELGIIDSEDLIEIILQVEEECECEFDPDGLDLESGLTLAGLIGSFVARAAGA